MKKLNNRGETLIESIVSLLMLSILMIGAYKIITGSLNMIEVAYEKDKAFMEYNAINSMLKIIERISR